jgi:hypothetical protein
LGAISAGVITVVVDVHPAGGAKTHGRSVVGASEPADDVAVTEPDEAEVFAVNWVELIRAWVRLGESRLDAGAGVAVEGAVAVV